MTTKPVRPRGLRVTTIDAMKIKTSNSEPKALRPFCNVCGWRKGGPDSWNGAECKCGHNEPPIQLVKP